MQTDSQTHAITSLVGLPSPRPSTLGVDRDAASTHAHESRSDTSSISQQQDSNTRAASASAVALLVEKVAALLVRMIQADVRTLTNRLKRQHLLPSGGDARHLSKATISSIVGEVASLRPPPGMGREDAAAGATVNVSLLTVTRGDIKALLKLFKDTFTELGMLREQINEIVFDPSVAHKIRKEATEPDSEPAKGDHRSASAMGQWIAPIQKLFSNQPANVQPPASEASSMASASSSSTSKPSPEVGRGKAPPRVAPKLAPAISASATTVNVEFASSGVRKTDTTSDGALDVTLASAQSPIGGVSPPPGPSPYVTGPATLRKPVALPHSASRNLMGIFAGAPRSVASPPTTPRWDAAVLPIVPPKSDKDRVRQIRGAASTAHLREPGTREKTGGMVATIGRSASTRHARRLSRHVDAMIDQKDDSQVHPDFHESLLERTLRPRGLSDSSIHTTFLKEMIESTTVEKPGEGEKDGGGEGALRPGALTDTSSSSTTGSQPCSPLQAVPRPYPIAERDEGVRSPAIRLGRHLASWATAATGGRFDDVPQPEELHFGSPREDGLLHHAVWSRRGLEGRDV